MVSKTDDIPASVPDCNPVDLADEAGDGAQDIKEMSKTGLKDSCGSGENLKLLLTTLGLAWFTSYLKRQCSFVNSVFLCRYCGHFSGL